MCRFFMLIIYYSHLRSTLYVIRRNVNYVNQMIFYMTSILLKVKDDGEVHMPIIINIKLL